METEEVEGEDEEDKASFKMRFSEMSRMASTTYINSTRDREGAATRAKRDSPKIY